MGYPIEIRLASKNGWHTPEEARRYYGRYSRDGLTVHWWNSPDKVVDGDHDNICNYILGKASRGAGSCNYVLSNNKITLLVNPDNVAWASEGGNPTTVSVEFSPHLNDEGYKKAGWLLNELEGRYGKVLRLYKHKDWVPSTACPGHLSLDRIRQEADKWKRGDYNPKPVPPTPVPVPPSEPNLTWHIWKEGALEYLPNKQPTYLYDVNTTTWGGIKQVKPFDKGLVDGKPIVIVGHIHNKALNRDYYITKFTFDSKATNGFHPADLDVYVAPRPVPEPPKPPVPTPPTPTPEPVDPDRNAIIAFLVMLVAKLGELLIAAKDLLGRFKR